MTRAPGDEGLEDALADHLRIGGDVRFRYSRAVTVLIDQWMGPPSLKARPAAIPLRRCLELCLPSCACGLYGGGPLTWDLASFLDGEQLPGLR